LAVSQPEKNAYAATIEYLIVCGGARWDISTEEDLFLHVTADSICSLCQRRAPWCVNVVNTAIAVRDSVIAQQQKSRTPHA
jgi:hypothetical protein